MRVINPLVIFGVFAVSCRPAIYPDKDQSLNDDCRQFVSNCTLNAHKATLAYNEPALRVFELPQTFCGAMVSTISLANARMAMSLAESSHDLVALCFEYDRLPYSTASTCQSAIQAADRNAAASLSNYRIALEPSLAKMTLEEKVEFLRAYSTAAEGELPFGPDHVCVK